MQNHVLDISMSPIYVFLKIRFTKVLVTNRKFYLDDYFNGFEQIPMVSTVCEGVTLCYSIIPPKSPCYFEINPHLPLLSHGNH